MKSEFRVIGHDHGPVNQDPGIVLIAHHGLRGCLTGSGHTSGCERRAANQVEVVT